MQQLLSLSEKLRFAASPAAAACAPYRQLVAAACTFVLQSLEAFVAACLTTCLERAAAATAAASLPHTRRSLSPTWSCCSQTPLQSLPLDCNRLQHHQHPKQQQKQQQHCPLYSCSTLKRLGFYSIWQRAARQQQQQQELKGETEGDPLTSPGVSSSSVTNKAAAAAALAACRCMLQLLVLQLNESAFTLRILVSAAVDAATATNGHCQQVAGLMAAASSFLSLALHVTLRLSRDSAGISIETLAAAAAAKELLEELQCLLVSPF